jgi:hypothetical protein
MERPAKNASAISASSLSLTGTLVLHERPAPGSFQVPGKSYKLRQLIREAVHAPAHRHRRRRAQSGGYAGAPGTVAVLVGEARAWGRVFARGLGIVAFVLAAVVAFEPGLAPGLGHEASPGGRGGV